MRLNAGFALLIISLAALTACGRQYSGRLNPAAARGSLDLRAWNFEKDGPVKLNGEWEFHWKKFLKPGDFARAAPKPIYVRFPGVWSDYGKEYGGDGYATYRLEILTRSDAPRLALKLPSVQSAYELHVDGRLLAANGRIAKTRKEEVPQYLPLSREFNPRGGKVELILLISNFSHRKGGPWDEILLGPANQIGEIKQRRITGDVFLFGVLFIIGLYHLGLFAINRKQKSALYFGLFCLIIGLRLMLTGERYFIQLFPDIPWGLARRMEILSFYLAAPIFGMYAMALFPRDLPRRLLQAVMWLCLPCAALVVFLPPRISGYTAILVQLGVIIACLAFLLVMYRAIRARRPDAELFAAGFLLLFLAILNDLLFALQLIETGFIVPAGLFIFIFLQSILLAIRFSRAFFRVENLTQAMTRFVPREFLGTLGKTDITEIRLGDSREMNLTVLFSDIRSFTTMSETMSIGENFAFLNSYLQRMEPRITGHGGFVDKYIGDAIMALFADPGGADVDNALAAALAMRDELTDYNAYRESRGFGKIEFGLSIHSGPLMMGTIGSRNRLETTVIGTTVNLASRLENLSAQYNVPLIISDASFRRLANRETLQAREIDSVTVKGMKEPTIIHEIFACDDEATRELKEKTRGDFSMGIYQYKAANFKEARKFFRKVLKVHGDDNIASLYVDRCNWYSRHPPPDDWNGVVELDRK